MAKPETTFGAGGAIFHRGVRIGWIEDTGRDWVVRFTHHPIDGRFVRGHYTTERDAHDAARKALERKAA